MKGPTAPSAVLVIDSGSPIVSIAFGAPGHVVSRRAIARAESSEALLRAIDEVLDEAGAAIGDVDGLVALRGPGSFTGLRVGLATVLGLHQALGMAATAVPTLEVLGRSAKPGREPVVALVDALRDEWFVQRFAIGEALGKPEILSSEALSRIDAGQFILHSSHAEAAKLPTDIESHSVEELAPLVLDLLAREEIEWAKETLLDPLYLRQPAIHGRG